MIGPNDKCPSCGAGGDAFTDESIRFRHTKDCKIGQVVCVAGHVSALDSKKKWHCTKCTAWFALSRIVELIVAPDDCPVCWGRLVDKSA